MSTHAQNRIRTDRPEDRPQMGHLGTPEFAENAARIRAAFSSGRRPLPPVGRSLTEVIGDAYRTMNGLPPAAKPVESKVIENGRMTPDEERHILQYVKDEVPAPHPDHVGYDRLAADLGVTLVLDDAMKANGHTVPEHVPTVHMSEQQQRDLEGGCTTDA